MLFIFRPIGEKLLKSKYSNLFELTEKMCSQTKNKRPNCDKILKKRNSFALSLNEFLRLKTDFKINGNIESMEERFQQYFIQKKLSFVPKSSPTLIDRILNFTTQWL